MNATKSHHPLGVLTASLLVTTALCAAEPAGTTTGTPDSIGEIFSKGKVSFGERVRFESVDQSNRDDANALTFRTSLSFTTAPFQGFTGSLELEDVRALDESDYAPAPASSTTATDPAVIADPVGTELNQAWIGYVAADTTLKAGRINLVLDNARFIGNVGWRQNNQTFDGATLQYKGVEKLTLTYGYLAHINRIFGDNIAGGDWDSDSHVLNASYTGLPVGTLTGYAYLLDFDNAAAQSCATYGVSFVSAQKISDKAKLSYRAEFATQSDYGSSTLNYSATYLVGEVGAAVDKFGGAIGYEELGTDNGTSFRTPLATLHAFNGWNDLFLTTPATGLRDTYVRGNVTLMPNLALLGFYHDFNTDTGANLGKEYDVQLTYKFNKYFAGLLKYGSFNSDSTLPDVKKFWAQVEFKY